MRTERFAPIPDDAPRLATIRHGRRTPESGTLPPVPVRAPRGVPGRVHGQERTERARTMPGGFDGEPFGGFDSDSAHLLVLPQRIETRKSGSPDTLSTNS